MRIVKGRNVTVNVSGTLNGQNHLTNSLIVMFFPIIT